jgi:hypothetical protein
MSELDVYNAIRYEIIANHVLLHVYTITVAIVLLIGIAYIENRNTILSVFLPLLSLAWAAAVVRFDFFIHRQAIYLRTFESQLLSKGSSVPMWETWKSSVRATQFIIPTADLIGLTVIVIPTICILFGPAQQFFRHRHWKCGKLYAWSVSVLLLTLLCFLTIIPKIAGL